MEKDVIKELVLLVKKKKNTRFVWNIFNRGRKKNMKKLPKCFLINDHCKSDI